jgi:hypothetical protein
MRGGKARKMRGRLATVNQVRDGGKELRQKLLQLESAMQIFYHRTSQPNLALIIEVFWISSKHILYNQHFATDWEKIKALLLLGAAT